MTQLRRRFRLLRVGADLSLSALPKTRRNVCNWARLCLAGVVGSSGEGLMQIRVLLAVLVLGSVLGPTAAAESLEKAQKKQLESQVKAIKAEAQSLEQAGKLAEARTKYAESQALLEMKDVTDALKHLDEEIKKRVKDTLNDSRKFYEVHKYKEAAAALEDGLKLQAFQPVLAYNLALCYQQLGERAKAVEYLRKAEMGTADPKEKQKLLQLMTFITTGESGNTLKDSDKERTIRVNKLSENIGTEASLEDEGGGEEDPTIAEDNSPMDTPASSGPGPGAASAQLVSSQSVSTPALSTPPVPAPAAKTNAPAGMHSSVNASHRSSLCNALGELKGPLASSPSETFNLANCAESNGSDRRRPFICWRSTWRSRPRRPTLRKRARGLPT